MKHIIMFSPDGKASVGVHPGKVEQMKEQGWTTEQPKKSKLKATSEEVNNG